MFCILSDMDLKEKLEIIKSVGEEIVSEEELSKLLKEKKHPVAYDGFEPSGQIHIAQGLLRTINVNKLTSTGIKFKFYVADWFAMLNNKYGGDLEKIKIVGEYFIEVWRACGLDMNNVEFIWTSDFVKEHPEYWETVLKLSMSTTVNRVLRCGQIMGREENTNNPASQILYPLMQAADIHHLGADIAQLGMDQRKVNMLARDLFPRLGFKPPVVISHHMLMGLSEPKADKNMSSIDRKIEIKMSKSKPDTAIFMTDSEEEIKRKFKKAYCPEGKTEDNPIMEYMKYIIFEKFKEITIERPEKFGGAVNFKSYSDLEKAYLKKEIHPVDLKNCCAIYINELLIPVQEHFEKNKKAKKLLEKVKSFTVSR
jgi:tyrosyl-tRNA synthetase